MNNRATPHLEFAPPAQPGMGRAWLIAFVAHALLFLALGLATAWKTQPQKIQAEAELWSAVPQAAAPKLQEPPPPPPEPEAKPAPLPKPQPPQPTSPPAPDNSLRDAQIALDKKKQEEKNKLEAGERQRKALERQKKEAEEKAAKDKAAKDKAAKDKALKDKAAQEKLAQEKKELEKKKAADKAKADEKKRQQEQERKAAQDKASEAQAQALRNEQMQRVQGLAGASGDANASGTALKSSGPSATYAGRLVGRIKPNIVYPGDVVGNPQAEVEMRVAPDGTIQSRRLKKSSGNKAWDDAVLRAIDKTEMLPKDTDGRVPPLIELVFRPLD